MPETPAPDFTGIKSWINADPLTMKRLRGKVVLIDFWTYTCVNCLRTLPYLKKWYQRYRDNGLVVVGIHSPEFEFEKDIKNVQAAVKRLGIRYPVAADSDLKTWSAYKNRFWPCHYIIDGRGVIRHMHAGEGAYAETELWIVKLLGEGGIKAKPQLKKTERPSYNVNTTLETYCGSLRGELGNGEVCLPEGCRYVDPQKHDAGRIYLDGHWSQQKEYLENSDAGHMTLVFRAKSVNLVMAPANEKTTVRVTVDNKPLEAPVAGADVKNGSVLVDRPDMYNLYNKKEFGTHELRIFADKPVRFFALTFG